MNQLEYADLYKTIEDIYAEIRGIAYADLTQAEKKILYKCIKF